MPRYREFFISVYKLSVVCSFVFGTLCQSNVLGGCCPRGHRGHPSLEVPVESSGGCTVNSPVESRGDSIGEDSSAYNTSRRLANNTCKHSSLGKDFFPSLLETVFASESRDLWQVNILQIPTKIMVVNTSKNVMW